MQAMERSDDGELVDMSRFPHLRKAARAALRNSFRFSSNYTDDPDLGYDCSASSDCILPLALYSSNQEPFFFFFFFFVVFRSRYDCSNLWDKSNYKIVDDESEFAVRMRALASQLAQVHLDDIPKSKVEATLRATNGHVCRAMQQLYAAAPAASPLALLRSFHPCARIATDHASDPCLVATR